jgi:hypothetical protein
MSDSDGGGFRHEEGPRFARVDGAAFAGIFEYLVGCWVLEDKAARAHEASVGMLVLTLGFTEVVRWWNGGRLNVAGMDRWMFWRCRTAHALVEVGAWKWPAFVE